jgi:protein TonB
MQVMKNKAVSCRKSGFLHVVVLLFILMLSGNLLFAQQDNRTMPEYKNGIDGLMQFIGQNLRYQVFARDNCISGKVLITFKVTTEGTLDSIIVTHSIHESLGDEAARLIKLTENDWIHC